MFGLTLKSRTAEALRRGVQAIVRGGFIDNNSRQNLGLNTEANSYLHSEIMAHQLYSLGLIYGRALVGKHNWATPEFFFRSVAKALAEGETAQHLPAESLSRVLLERFLDFEGLSPEERKARAHVRQSAMRVSERDERVPMPHIEEVIENAAASFFRQAKGVFGI